MFNKIPIASRGGIACFAVLLSTGCADEPRAAEPPPVIIAHPVQEPRPSRPIFRRDAAAVARLVDQTCFAAIGESASAERFGAMLADAGQSPQPAPASGRMTAWDVPGGTISYTNSPKGGFAESILCLVSLDPRGAPRADPVAAALARRFDRRSEPGANFGPWGLAGHRWAYSPEPGEQTVINLGDIPSMCGDEGVGCSPASLAIHIAHTAGAGAS